MGNMSTLRALQAEEKACRKCPLRNGCTQVVVGEGHSPAPIMVVGDVSRIEDDKVGRPFVGSSGKLLNKMFELAGLDPSSLFLTNVCRCRNIKRKTPTSKEISS